MINLLPPDLKTGYLYAKRNVRLRYWIVMCLAALVGLAAITTYGLFTIKQATDDYINRNSISRNGLKQGDYAGTQKKARDISNSFKLLVQVLSKEVLFSSLIKQLGANMPDNTYLTGLSIPQAQGSINITANAVDYRAASQVQVNLSDPKNKLFSKADIESIICTAAATDLKHPCTITIKALFVDNNPFLFINSQGKPQ